MTKIRNIFEYQSSFSFLTQEDQFSKFITNFLQSNLGKIYEAIPWDKMVKTLGLKDHKKGPQSIFSPKGKIALMFLKNYCNESDRKLIEQLNGNIEYQFFCGIYLGEERISNYKIVSKIRTELGELLDVEKLQQSLYDSWKEEINVKSCMTMDTTCYESHIRYPTDVKLLWEGVEWCYKNMNRLNKLYGLGHYRTKYIKWVKRYVSYSKMRRKTKKKRNPLTRALLKLLKKLTKKLSSIAIEHGYVGTPRYERRLSVIRRMYVQQYEKFHEGKRPKNAIVSIDKDYIRPIVRGKEKSQLNLVPKYTSIKLME